MRADVTVVICVYTERRWSTSTEAIAAVLRQKPWPAEVLVVVDHNDALYKRLADHVTSAGLSVRVVRNARTRGLSGGRNTALELVTTSHVAFLDDDAVPRPGWLEGLLDPFVPDPRGSVVAVGGRAEPVWSGSGRRPWSLPPELGWVVGCSYEGQFRDVGPQPARNVMGCSMAFATEAVRAVGGFDEALGRVGTLPVGCEETELCIRLGQRGEVIVLTPVSVVDHHVSADRLSLRYVARRSWGEGVSKRIISDAVGGDHALSNEKTYAVHTLPLGAARCLGGRDAERHPLGALAIVVSLVGAVAGYLLTGIRRLRGRSRPLDSAVRSIRA